MTSKSDGSYKPLSASSHTLRQSRVPRLLLVEDNPADVALFEEQLEFVDEFHFCLEWVDTLSSAILAVQKGKFDCIILDLSLPDSQGLDTFQTMRKHAMTTAIVILTGETDRDVMARALTQGADSYLLKGSCVGNRIAISVISAMRNFAAEHHERTEWVPMSEQVFHKNPMRKRT